MSDMKIGIVGAAGRMGQNLIKAVHSSSGAMVASALERDGSEHIGADCGVIAGLGEIGVTIGSDAKAAFETCDAIIDFTSPAATCAFAKLAAETGTKHIIGTTGCTEDDDAEIAAAAKDTTIVKSGNMSLGVNLLAVLVEQAAQALGPDAFDIEVLEMHHKHKVDAPSGTALLLGEAAAKGRGNNLNDHSVRSRDCITGAREDGTIGFATLRGGSVIGEHSVILAGNGERIELTHLAQDRALFASGAVKAALWANDKPSGLYSMRDVLGI